MKLCSRFATALLLLAIAFTHTTIGAAQTVPNAAGQLTQQDATAAITQALGGNAAAANQIIQGLGGDPTLAVNAFSSGNAAASLAGTFGNTGAISTLTQAFGPGPSIAALSNALGPNGTLNALTGSLGGSAAIQTLATSIIGNQSAINIVQASLGGNTQGLRSLNAFLSGNAGALPGLTIALGGSQATLSAFTGALGPQGAIGALATAIGADQALSVLTGALGPTGALNALTAAVGGQISLTLAAIGVTLPTCGTAPLTGTFATSACNTTTNNRNIAYAQQNAGGKDVARKIEELHTDRLLPALKDSTAQLSAGALDQSRQLGTVLDAAQMADAKQQIELQELDARQGLLPSEQACALPTAGPALAQTKRAGHALSRALVNDFSKRANPTPGQPSARGFGAVVAKRYEEYCRLFLDPDDNNGISGCAEILEEAGADAPGKQPASPPVGQDSQSNDSGRADQDDEKLSLSTLPNADIDIEGLLLRDTIDIDQPGVRQAVEGLLDNLTQNEPYPKLPPAALNTAAGAEWTVKKERIETIRNLSARVIADMVSRRIGIPLPQAVSEGGIMNTMEGGPSGQCNLPAAAGDANTKTKAFAEYYRNNPRTSDFWGSSTMCQRFSYSASGGTAFAGKPTIRLARAAAFGGAPTTASPAPAQGGGNADRALTAWSHFRRTGVAQPFDATKIKPGDLLYMVKNTRLGKYERDFRNGCNGDACEAGHTGVYMGAKEICHVFHSPASGQPIICTTLEYLTREVGHPYTILGFVRPSGVNAQVADCTFDYNNGVQPGAPVEVATGPHAGEQSGNSPSTVPTPRPTSDPAAPGNPPSAESRGDYRAYLAALAQSESGGGGCNNGGRVGYNGQTGPGYRCVNSLGYMGKYQMGRPALNDVGCMSGRRWKNCFGYDVRGPADFLNNPDLQERAIRAYNNRQFSYTKPVHSQLCSYVGSLRISPSGLLAGAHLVGHGPAKTYVRTHGRVSSADANGVRVQHYMRKLGGFTLDNPWPSNACNAQGLGGPPDGQEGGSQGFEFSDYSTPAPPRTVREIIAEIRERAGIPVQEIAHDPSYNEIMLAMTKERFFDPAFFSQMADNVPAMQRTETSLDAYIAMTLKDIESLQEQINALSAARASMRIDELDRDEGP